MHHAKNSAEFRITDQYKVYVVYRVGLQYRVITLINTVGPPCTLRTTKTCISDYSQNQRQTPKVTPPFSLFANQTKPMARQEAGALLLIYSVETPHSETSPINCHTARNSHLHEHSMSSERLPSIQHNAMSMFAYNILGYAAAPTV